MIPQEADQTHIEYGFPVVTSTTATVFCPVDGRECLNPGLKSGKYRLFKCFSEPFSTSEAPRLALLS